MKNETKKKVGVKLRTKNKLNFIFDKRISFCHKEVQKGECENRNRKKYSKLFPQKNVCKNYLDVKREEDNA